MPNLDTLGQTKIPSVFAKIQRKGYVDLMTVTGETRTRSVGGGQVKSASPNVYEDIPVTYEPMKVSSINNASERAVSLNEYILTFATHIDGTRIEIDVKNHRLKIQARESGEPEKIFRIEALRDHSGVLWEAVCIKEN